MTRQGSPGGRDERILRIVGQFGGPGGAQRAARLRRGGDVPPVAEVRAAQRLAARLLTPDDIRAAVAEIRRTVRHARASTAYRSTASRSSRSTPRRGSRPMTVVAARRLARNLGGAK